MWHSGLLLLLCVRVSLQSRCWQGPSFPSSVLPPAVVGQVGGMVRVSGVPSLSRCVEAACDVPWGDVAWFFQGRCYVVSCQQRAQCRPQRRPGAQSHLAFIQRSPALPPALYWGEYKSSEAPGDLQALKDLGLLRSQLDYEDPDLGEMEYPPSNEETEPTDQSEVSERDGLNHSEAGNKTTPTTVRHSEEPTQRPLQDQVQSSVSPNLTADSNTNQEITSLPVSTKLVSLPVWLKTASLPALVDSSSATSASPLVSVDISVEPTVSHETNAATHSDHTPDSLRAPAVPSPSTPVQPAPVQSVPVQSAAVLSDRPVPTAAPCSSPPAPSAHSALLGPAPVAHAGGSYTLTLPNSSVVLQGSATNTDPRTVHYLWTRDAQSPAAGDVLFGSDTRSSLVLVNLVEGSYLFHLRVTDAEGRSASASATVQVLPEPGGAEEVELEMQVSVSQVSVSQRDTVVSQLSALLHVPPSNIHLRGLYGHAPLSTVLRFSVRTPSGPVPGSSVVSLLKNHLLRDRTEYLLFRVLRVDTVVCQLQCSGRGQCDPVSRLCLCDPFWTENLLRTYLGDGQRNCEWRVLYVILSGFILVILILSAAWTFMCCCRRKRQSKVRRKTRYTILDNVDEQERVELRPKFSLKHRSTEHNSSLMMSESELSDQDFRDPPLRSRNRTKAGLNRV